MIKEKTNSIYLSVVSNMNVEKDVFVKHRVKKAKKS